MTHLRHMAALAGALATASPSLAAAPDEAQWPDREWLIASLVRAIPAILATQDPNSGRFGTDPWTCSDQNVLFPLAAAWDLEDAANPFHHDPALLEAIGKGGERLTAEQDANGMWTFRKKDNSTWGQIHMPWTYSRWVRAYALLRDHLPPPTRARWEEGLQRGFEGIRRYADGRVHNIPAHHAMALYAAGACFEKEDWRRAAAAFMAKVVAEQDPGGFWSENHGPVVGYNAVYVDALGVYYAMSGDTTVMAALERSARFHAAFLWPDGTAIAAIDERQVYRPEQAIGNVGFSHTPEGRGFLLYQTRRLRARNLPIDADYAAAMLLYGGAGKAVPPPTLGEEGRFILGDNKALVQRRAPWQICLSAYCCPVPKNRWIQDRQNFVDVFHDDLGLVFGGGNTKLQPYWSTFTVGNPAEVHHRPGDINPNFRPHTDLRWVPTRTVLRPDPQSPALDLVYHDHTGRVAVRMDRQDALSVTYTMLESAGKRFEAHVPFLKRRGRIRFACGRSEFLGDKALLLDAATTGDWFEWDGLRVSVPPQARFCWPARQHNPYTKDGAAPLTHARLVVVLPLTAQQPDAAITLAKAPDPVAGEEVIEARRLDVVSPSGTPVKPLDDLGSVFLKASKPGEAMTFALPVRTPGIYELFADFVMFPSYGTVQLSLDGTPVGEPFDAYAPELDVSGPIPLGKPDLARGVHDLTVTVTGKNPRSSGMFVSVRRFVLRRP